MNVFLGYWAPGPLEIVLIAIAALLLFGKRLPELARSLGKSVTQFKKGVGDAQSEFKNALEDKEESAEDES